MSDDKDYEVGYGRPPKGTRWVKGQSGNRSGRRKGPPSIKSILGKRLAAKVVVKQDGLVLEVSSLEALLRSLIVLASKGNAQAIKMLFSLMERFGLGGEVPEPDPESDYDTRKALYVVLGRWLARQDKTGISADFTPDETRDILYAADSNILQMALPLGDPPASDRTPALAQQRPVVPRPRPEIDDDCLY